jgi:hypothetical protein
MAKEPEPATPLERSINFWMHTLAFVLGLIATAVGIYASVNSHSASSQADAANTKANANTQKLAELQYKLQAASNFAAGIHEARDSLAEKNRGIPAMVEVSRLYAVAQTPQQKLVLIQIAQLSKQQAAMLALSTLVANDPDLRPPFTDENRGSVAAITRIMRAATAQIAVSQTPQPKPAANRPANTPIAPPDDPSLTASSNHLIAASAALAASLPKTESERGWIFVGDADGWGGGAELPQARLISGTAATSSPTVPLEKATLTLCRDTNIRVVPFLDGALGTVVGIAPSGTVVTVVHPPPPYGKRIDAYRAVSRRTGRHITARWAYVVVAPAVAKPTAVPIAGADSRASAPPATPRPTSTPDMGACTAAPGAQAVL